MSARATFPASAGLRKPPSSRREDPLRTWRSRRLGEMKQRPEYKSLPLILRNIVDYMVRRHESPAEGITVSQGHGKGLTPGLSERFGVSRKTMNKYLRQIVE